jgi:hypothetical protein
MGGKGMMMPSARAGVGMNNAKQKPNNRSILSFMIASASK